MNDRLQALADAGVSIWLDDLSRERIETGNLASLVADSGVVGVTTNPTIFAAAIAKGERYAEQVKTLKASGADVKTTVFELTTTDVQNGCDIMRPVFDATGGVDGRVSIEVDPDLAKDTDGTVALAKRLWERVDRPNALIKIPATVEGLPAIAAAISEGISVNVTLIFSLERYRGVMDAYLYGLEQAAANGKDLSTIESVASFFVSRVDSEVDSRLARGQPAARQGGHRQRATGLRGVRGGLRVRSLQGSRRPGRQHAAPAVGLDRRQGSGLPRHDVRQRARRRRHRQHHAGEDARGVRRPR